MFIAYISTYISPQSVSWLAFFGLLYPYILLVNIIFTIFWILKKKLFFLFSLIAILIGWNFLASFLQFNVFSKNKDLSTNTFSFLSYNVRLFDLYNWSDNQATKSKVFNFLKVESPDIMCLQEFYYDETNKFPTLDTLLKFRNVNYVHDEYTSHVHDVYHFGIATFSKFPIINEGKILFRNTNNICIYTDIIIADDTIRIYNNHLQSVHFQPKNYNFMDSITQSYNNTKLIGIVDILKRIESAFIKRAFQVEYISEHIENSPYPVIVCGDFNDSPFSYCYRRMRKELADAFIESGMGIGNTYVRKFPSYRIDYILHSKDLKSYHYKKSKIKYSDHYPIQCEFQIIE